MLRIFFTGLDISRVRFASGPDPMWDVLLSLHLLQERDDSVVHGQWRNQIKAVLSGQVQLLMGLAPPRGYSPDFLTPGAGGTSLEESLDRLRSTRPSWLHMDMAYFTLERRTTWWTRRLAEGEPRALHILVETVKGYYRTGLAPYRRQTDAHIRADLAERSRVILAGGIGQLLSSLHPRVRWNPPTLEVLDYVDQEMHLHGRGIVLQPSLFCRHHPVTLKDSDRPPVLVYPVTPSIGWLSSAGLEFEKSRDPMASLLGSTRAATLRATAVACTTSELAQRVKLSIPAASRQAAALRGAKLITSERVGGAVVHRITDLGIALLNGELPV